MLQKLQKVHSPLVDLAILGLQAAQGIHDEWEDLDLKLVGNRDLCPGYSVCLANIETGERDDSLCEGVKLSQ
jgi:hypothetical protein